MSTIEQWIPVFSSNTTVTIPYCLKVKVCRYWDCYVAKALQHKDAVIQTLTEMRSAMVEDQIYAEAAEIIKAIKWYNTTTHWIKVSSQEKEDRWLLYYNSSRPERENHICRLIWCEPGCIIPSLAGCFVKWTADSPQKNDVMLGVCSWSQSSDTVHS